LHGDAGLLPQRDEGLIEITPTVAEVGTQCDKGGDSHELVRTGGRGEINPWQTLPLP
jgi:hypothetical protein